MSDHRKDSESENPRHNYGIWIRRNHTLDIPTSSSAILFWLGNQAYILPRPLPYFAGNVREKYGAANNPHSDNPRLINMVRYLLGGNNRDSRKEVKLNKAERKVYLLKMSFIFAKVQSHFHIRGVRSPLLGLLEACNTLLGTAGMLSVNLDY